MRRRSSYASPHLLRLHCEPLHDELAQLPRRLDPGPGRPADYHPGPHRVDFDALNTRLQP